AAGLVESADVLRRVDLGLEAVDREIPIDLLGAKVEAAVSFHRPYFESHGEIGVLSVAHEEPVTRIARLVASEDLPVANRPSAARLRVPAFEGPPIEERLPLVTAEILDPDVPEAIHLPRLAVMLKPDEADLIDRVVRVGRQDVVDEDADVIASALDAIPVPGVAIEGRLLLRLPRKRHEPPSPPLVVEASRPLAVRGIDLGLIPEHVVLLDVRAEPETRVRRALGHLDLGLEDEIAVLLLRDEKELPVRAKSDLSLLRPHLSPLIGVSPAGHGIARSDVAAIVERHP